LLRRDRKKAVFIHEVCVRVSVILASRLQVRSAVGPTCLWLERALRSVRRQSVATSVALEIVVGLDPDAALPAHLYEVMATNAPRRGQAAALNAAVAASSGEMLAFLEDDDYWEARRLEYGLNAREGYDLVTSNQREVNEDGGFIGINDYPTPSGWLLTRAAWQRVGGFSEEYTFVDSEWLGRANAAGLKRLHLVEAGQPDRPGLRNVARHSELSCTAERDPLVLRTVNPGGVVGTAQSQESARQRHERDTERLVERFGSIPW
jgi:hypothetical protein